MNDPPLHLDWLDWNLNLVLKFGLIHLMQLLFDHKNVLTVHQVIHKHGR